MPTDPTRTPRADIGLLAQTLAPKPALTDEALLQLDALLCTRFLDRDLSAPPSTPAEGDCYLVAATASGAWTTRDGAIAFFVGGAWRYYAPFAGLAAYVVDESKLIVFDGAAWVDYASILVLQNVPLLGVNATADATNKLAVKSAALLFDNIGGGVQAKLNKHVSGDTASLLYQTGYSGRTEIGLAGDDDLHLKVSPDGASWFEALKLGRADGLVSLPSGQLAFPAAQNPSSNANTLDDYEEGSWTPVVAGSTTAGTQTYSVQDGHYVKVGSAVFLQAALALTAFDAASAGNVIVTGLPFPSGGTANSRFFFNIRCGFVTFSSGYTMMMGTVVGAQATPSISFSQSGSGLGTLTLPVSAMPPGVSQFSLSGFYLASA